MGNIPFIKINGTGNDFVVIDNRKSDLPPLNWKKISDRNFGIGCDQVITLEKSSDADIFMRIFNVDGSESGACGNASRCVAWLAKQEFNLVRPVTIETREAILTADVKSSNQVTLDMGVPKLEWEDIPLAKKQNTLRLPIKLGNFKYPVAVNMGNPHMVFFVRDVNRINLAEAGAKLEKHKLFPKRTNVEIAQVLNSKKILLRVWERGTGLTLACGTGACATLVAAHLHRLTGRKADVHLPGGVLQIEWRKSDEHVLMTGAVEVNYKGVFDATHYRI